MSREAQRYRAIAALYTRRSGTMAPMSRACGLPTGYYPSSALLFEFALGRVLK